MAKIDFRYDLLPLKDELFRWVYGMMLSQMEAEDVVEDALVRVWEKREQLQEVDNLRAYCFRVCKNLALDRMGAANKKWVERQETMADLPSDELSPLEKVARKDRMVLIEQTLRKMNDKARRIFWLREVEEKSYAEIAEEMKVSQADVKVNLHRTRKHLKMVLIKYDEYGL